MQHVRDNFDQQISMLINNGKTLTFWSCNCIKCRIDCLHHACFPTRLNFEALGLHCMQLGFMSRHGIRALSTWRSQQIFGAQWTSSCRCCLTWKKVGSA